MRGHLRYFSRRLPGFCGIEPGMVLGERLGSNADFSEDPAIDPRYLLRALSRPGKACPCAYRSELRRRSPASGRSERTGANGREIRPDGVRPVIDLRITSTVSSGRKIGIAGSPPGFPTGKAIDYCGGDHAAAEEYQPVTPSDIKGYVVAQNNISGQNATFHQGQ